MLKVSKPVGFIWKYMFGDKQLIHKHQLFCELYVVVVFLFVLRTGECVCASDEPNFKSPPPPKHFVVGVTPLGYLSFTVPNVQFDTKKNVLASIS